MAQKKNLRYKIVAAPIGPCGGYRAWPDKTTYIRRFMSEGKRQDYWRRFVVPKSETESGLLFQITMIDEWSGGWEFVSEARYADQPTICGSNCDPSVHIVECGRASVTRKVS